jgi:hypothetical protein
MLLHKMYFLLLPTFLSSLSVPVWESHWHLYGYSGRDSNRRSLKNKLDMDIPYVFQAPGVDSDLFGYY